MEVVEVVVVVRANRLTYLFLPLVVEVVQVNHQIFFVLQPEAAAELVDVVDADARDGGRDDRGRSGKFCLKGLDGLCFLCAVHDGSRCWVRRKTKPRSRETNGAAHCCERSIRSPPEFKPEGTDFSDRGDAMCVAGVL